ncbi:MAG: hypothetical protein MZV64_73115 [Ignavibacteriales bacterium]|nr:hypothetical protein [Ignavibacteriales bacterium]
MPVGARTLTGCVIGVDEVADDDRARRGGRPPATSSTCSTARPIVPADVLALAAWVADYYACGPGEVDRGGRCRRWPGWRAGAWSRSLAEEAAGPSRTARPRR